ncbi:MAG: hypothetical protein JSR85_02700 [Proteobacteria bacterium]|nr:hypothetical protein [Pseudomonadota bacterium]
MKHIGFLRSLKKLFTRRIPLNKADFINLLLKKMRKVDRYPAPFYNQETDHIHWGEHTFYMDNLYEDLSLCLPEHQAKSINTTFTQFKIMMRRGGDIEDLPFKEIIPILMPTLRSRSYLLATQKHGEIPFRLLNEFVGICISLETEISIITPNSEHFEAWGVDFDTAFNYAIQNLVAVNHEGYEEIHPGVWRSMWKDGYDPSRILDGEPLWDLEIEGDPVIFIPHREVLIITGSEDYKGLIHAIEFCKDYHGLNRSISGFPFTLRARDDGRYELEIFSVEEDHPLYEKITELVQQTYKNEGWELQEINLQEEEKEIQKKRELKNSLGPFLNYYKKTAQDHLYWNARFDGLNLIINQGKINESNEVQIIKCRSKKERETHLENELEKVECQGYTQWNNQDLKPLIIKFDTFGPGFLVDLEKQYDIIDLMDDYLSETGLGYCADGQRGNGSMSILCPVIKEFKDIDGIIQVLTDNNQIDRISISIYEGNEENVVWPRENQ